MSLTYAVKSELIRVDPPTTAARVAELAAMIRFGGAITLRSERLVVTIECDTQEIAERALSLARTLYGCEGVILPVSAQSRSSASRKRSGRRVEWMDGAAEIVRRTGLIDRHGRAIRGLPPKVVAGDREECQATWRGAFLVAGTLAEPGRACALDIDAPGPEAALALIGHARRLGITSKSREVRGQERVHVREGDAIGNLLIHMGAPSARLTWEEQRQAREVRAPSQRLANFDDANLRRSARAAITASARVQRAMEILGDEVQDHLVQAGRLRVEHRNASLEELGELAQPPISKDAIAGRIRRLLTMADKRARELGIPDTYSVVTDDLYDEEEILAQRSRDDG